MLKYVRHLLVIHTHIWHKLNYICIRGEPDHLMVYGNKDFSLVLHDEK